MTCVHWRDAACGLRGFGLMLAATVAVGILILIARRFSGRGPFRVKRAVPVGISAA